MRCLEERPTARGTFEDVLEDTHTLLRKYGRNNRTETLEGNKVRLYINHCVFSAFVQDLLLIQFSSTFDHDSYMHAFIRHMSIERL